MEYQKHLIKTIAAESHFWPRIDKKYDDVGIAQMTRQQNVLNVINELPPKALLRAIKLLAINDTGRDGQEFVADLLQKVFRKEIEYLIENKDTLNFENFLAQFGDPDMSTSKILRLTSIYLHLRNIMSLPADESDLLKRITRAETNSEIDFLPAAESEKMAKDWLKSHNFKSLNELSYDEKLFTADFMPLGVITKRENIPLRAYENYVISKNDVSEMIDIANRFRMPYDINRLLTNGYILKSLAKYADECKNAYLDLALSAEVSPTKKAKSEIAKLHAEIERLHADLSKKQDLLNDAQLKLDKQQRLATSAGEELEELKSYVAVLEQQLDRADGTINAADDFITPDFTGKKVVVVGGHDNWQQKLRVRFADFTFIAVDDNDFDVNLVRAADLIIFNFAHCSHKQFYRLKKYCDMSKIVYVTSTNIDVLMRQVAGKD